MGRKNVETGVLDLDVIDQVCLSLQLPDEQCALVREAAEEYCKERYQKGKRQPSEFNIFMATCMKERKEQPVTERFRKCVEEWREKKKE